jgi:hypothetical protein
MLQLLYIDIAKVDWDVTHVVMGIYDISSVCFKCFICSRCMLQVFYLDIAYTYMLQAYVSSVSRCFIHMFASVSFECCI